MYISWGTDLYGSVDEIPGVGHVATKFGFINYVPILPMGTYFVVAQTGDGWRGVDLPVSFKSILVAWLRTAAFIGIISTGIWLAIEGFAYRDNRPNDVLAAGVWFAACVCVMWASMKWRLLVGASYERAIEIADQIKAGDERRDVVWHGGLESHERARGRQPEGDAPGVQGRPRESAGQPIERNRGEACPRRTPVCGVADDGPAAIREMHADLMGAPGAKPAADERQTTPVARRPRERLVLGGRRRSGRAHDHAPPIERIAPERRVQEAALVGASEDHCQVVLLSVAQRLLQRRVRRPRLGHDDETRRAAIETLHEVRGPRAGGLFGASEQRVHERAAAPGGGGVGDESGRLHDDEQVVVFVQHVERDRSLGRRRRRWTGGRDVDPDDVARCQTHGDAPRERVVHVHAAGRDQTLDRRARQRVRSGEVPLDGLVEPVPGVAAVGDERGTAEVVNRDS